MHIEFDKFDKLTMGDLEFSKQLLDVYIGQFIEYIDEMKQHVAEHDLNKIRFLNHKIRSSVTVLGVTDLLECQVKMNTLAAREESPEKLVAQYAGVEEMIKEVITILQERLHSLSAAV
jgi:HPt (histidine-containing phosphotransfer) domain-containing protein